MFLVLIAVSTMCLHQCAVRQIARSNELSPMEKAIAIGKELSEEYQYYYKEVSFLYQEGDVETRAFLEERVNPHMNNARGYLVDYLRLVKMWQDSQLTSPPSALNDAEEGFRRLLRLAITAFLELQQET